MQFLSFKREGQRRLGCLANDEVVDLTELGAADNIDEVLAAGPEAMAALANLASSAKHRIAQDEIEEWLPPISDPGKAIAIGLNYVDHASEVEIAVPDYPIIFNRFRSSWVGHKQPIVHPKVSHAFDYEGEMVAVIGKRGRHIPKEDALSYVAGYSIFNEGSVRDYQAKSHQWTIGKNFDSSGGFGPYFVTADELPEGARGLRLQTILNGRVLQDANTNDMIFDVATLVSEISDAMELAPGDIIITGTPSGIGAARDPRIFMHPGDVCEISIDGLGKLSNTVVAE